MLLKFIFTLFCLSSNVFSVPINQADSNSAHLFGSGVQAFPANKNALQKDFNKEYPKKTKREDSVDRAQDAQIGGALRGFVIPDLYGMIPTSPLGGQAPDDD